MKTQKFFHIVIEFENFNYSLDRYFLATIIKELFSLYECNHSKSLIKDVESKMLSDFASIKTIRLNHLNKGFKESQKNYSITKIN